MSNLHVCFVFRIGQLGNNVPKNAEEIYEKSVKKLIGLLYSNPRIFATISFSGVMLEWYEKNHPEVIGTKGFSHLALKWSLAKQRNTNSPSIESPSPAI